MSEQGGGSCRFVVSDGVRIHYHVRGSGPPVVLLHGYPEYWNVWLHQIADLSRDYCVIAPDLRGFNLSDGPKGVEQYFAGTVGQRAGPGNLHRRIGGVSA
jgi:pimeloyl-ACP methyl ester carboxylesterase